MTGSPAADRDALEAAIGAARERQSHVRHELRAPLAVIYPLLSLLLDGGAGELSPKQRGSLETLDRNVARLEGLITAATASGWTDCSVAPALPAVWQSRTWWRRFSSCAESTMTADRRSPSTPGRSRPCAACGRP